MSIIANQYTTELESIWDCINWDRKFDQPTPRFDRTAIAEVFHACDKKDVERADHYFQNTLEETNEVIRSAYFTHYSTGAAIVVCETAIDDLDD